MGEKIQHLEELLSNTPPGTDRHKQSLVQLAKWYTSKSFRTNDISDIEESIKYSRLSLDAIHSSELLISLQTLLFHAFEKTNKISYLDESITIGYDILESKNAQPIHFHAFKDLISSLLTREQFLASGQNEDLHEAIRLIPMFTDSQYVQ